MSVCRAKLISIASFVSFAIILAVALSLAGQPARAQASTAEAYNAMNDSLRICEDKYEQARKRIAEINDNPFAYTVGTLNATKQRMQDAQDCAKRLLKRISELEQKFPELAGGNTMAGRSDDLRGQWAQLVAAANNLQKKVNLLKLPAVKPK